MGFGVCLVSRIDELELVWYEPFSEEGKAHVRKYFKEQNGRRLVRSKAVGVGN